MGTSIEQRKSNIRATRARRQRRELSSLVHAESRWRNQFMAGVLVVVFGWLLVLLVHLSGY